MEKIEEIEKYEEEVVALRRDIHRHPELGLEEYRTSEKVSYYLAACGMETSRMNKTGVVGLLRGEQPGPTLLMRADMDALPIQEENEVPYRSTNDGIMHACGHDAHTAMLLVAAKILSRMKDRIAGAIKFVFQPNEENVGALAMIEEGLLEGPSVDACTGIHVWTPLQSGRIGVADGPVMAGMEHFELVVKGRGGHTATPHTAIDPILTAASIIQGVQALQTREIDVLREPALVMFGKIEGGSASNIVPDSVRLSGTMRYLFGGDRRSGDSPEKKFERIVANICAAHRAQYELEYTGGHPTLVNDREMANLVRSAARKLDPVPEIESLVSLAGEDFSEFASRVPGAFCFLGAGNPDKRTQYPHHHPRFDIDEDVLIVGVELHVRCALDFFDKAGELKFLNTSKSKSGIFGSE